MKKLELCSCILKNLATPFTIGFWRAARKDPGCAKMLIKLILGGAFYDIVRMAIIPNYPDEND